MGPHTGSIFSLTIVNTTKSPNYSVNRIHRVCLTLRMSVVTWFVRLSIVFVVNGVISGLSDISDMGLDIFSWGRWDRWGEWAVCWSGVPTMDDDVCAATLCNYPDYQLGCRSHWTLWWIYLVSRGTDNNWPQKQNTDYTKNKMHYIYVIITYQRINCEMCWWFSRNRIVSFFPSRKLLQFLLLLLLSQLLDPGCQSLCIHQDGVPHFLWDRHPAHLLASHPILLFQAVSGGNEMLQLW